MRFAIPGYEGARANNARIVALNACLGDIRSIVETQSLYEYAASQPAVRIFQGRGPTYGITLPGACGRVVVRHARRGGLPAQFSSDLFVSRLRPLRELIAAFRLRSVGVPAPELVAYVTYTAGIFFRYDVATREVEGARDLAAWLADTSDIEVRAALIHATAELLDQLAEAGAHHSDINAKNILVVESASALRGVVIDVDRVSFHVPRSPMVMDANLERLERSLRKLQRLGLRVTDKEIGDLRLRSKELHSQRGSHQPIVSDS